MTNLVRFEENNPFIEQIKSATGITDDAELIDHACAIYWLLLSLSIDNTVMIALEDGSMARFGLNKGADRFIQRLMKKSGR